MGVYGNVTRKLVHACLQDLHLTHCLHQSSYEPKELGMDKLKVPSEKPSSSNRSSTTSLTSRSSVKVTRQEFEDFCEGDEDPMLKFLAEELHSHTRTPSQSMPTTRQEARYQNSFRTEPTYKFYPDKVSHIIKEALEERLEGTQYDSRKSAQVACELSTCIKDRVKRELSVPRHKLVAFVTIGERKDQGALMGSRCVWNEKFDSYASSSFKNDTLFAVGVLYAVYLE